jgi:hypothetical protein
METVGEDFGLSSTTYRLDLELSDGSSRQAVIKLAPATPSQREHSFYEHCAAETPLRVPGFNSSPIGVSPMADEPIDLAAAREQTLEVTMGDG